MAAAVLLAMGRARDVGGTLAAVRRARPGASPNRRQVEQLRSWAAERESGRGRAAAGGSN